MCDTIAIIIALYNGAEYIEKQLESLLFQTQKIDAVIVGDDGSDDNSVEIVSIFIEKYDLSETWKVVENQQNRGHAGNFMALCEMVDADFIFFCDQDDIWMPNKISSMVSIMKNNEQIHFLYGDVINTCEPGKQCITESANYDKSVTRISFSEENYFFKGLGCASCIRGAFMKNVLSYWTDGWEHDMFFWACAIMTNSGYKYNYPVIWRRIHEKNASIKGEKTLEGRAKQVELSLARPISMRRLLKNENIKDDTKTEFIDEYESVLKRREEALKRKKPLLAVTNLFGGRAKFYLHKSKGVLLDVFLIIFKRYSM